MKKCVIYGEAQTCETSASGISGLLCRSLNNEYFFRITTPNGQVQDYDLLHSDLAITIDKGQLASLYVNDGIAVLDHSSTVLGLKVLNSDL